VKQASNDADKKAMGTGKSRPGVEEQRRLIAHAAVTLFGRQSSSVTSVSDICKAAGVSRDTFYRCFADKEALINALYQSSVNEHVLAVLNPASMNFSDENWVEQVSEETVDAILAQSAVAQFLYLESADPKSYAHQLVHEAYDNAAQRMQQWASQEFWNSQTIEYIKSLLFATQWLVHNAILSGQTEDQVRIAKQSIKQVFYGAFASIQRGEIQQESR